MIPNNYHVVKSVHKLMPLSEYRLFSDACFDCLYQSDALSYEDLTEWIATTYNAL